jgi:peptidyl-tRNA hydrolase, PTH1 family
MLYLVGLGNPGNTYALTRHNVGRMAVQYMVQSVQSHGGVSSSRLDKKNAQHTHTDTSLSEDLSLFTKDKMINAYTARMNVGQTEALCILPETFMNESGITVAKAIAQKKLGSILGMTVTGKHSSSAITERMKHLVVIQDDLDIPFGQIKLVYDRGTGGHKGIESIAHHLHSNAFVRIKIGILSLTPQGVPKKPLAGAPVSDFVLSRFHTYELDALGDIFERVLRMVHAIAEHGYLHAMNLYNQQGGKGMDTKEKGGEQIA